ncbi:sensor histidine kinase [Spirochaeta lutea]|uniref:histidine kinase n=1 Tax=Spirochaeta lutea TaxID=1480694 RepID=A0A098QTH1_9SPIO|nr:sensor histidine kinase [Spirochaeta lutea]KGE71029.1 hypothetical protein DC28_14020 [Spirochaeta lutea]
MKDPNPSTTFRRLMVLLLVLIHGVFFSLAFSGDVRSQVPAQWYGYILPAGLLGLGVGILGIVADLPWHFRGVILLLRVLLLYVLVLPVRGQVLLGLILFLSLTVECYVLFSMPVAVGVLGGILLVYWQMPLPEFFWGREATHPQGQPAILGGFFALWSVLLGGIGRAAWDSNTRSQEQLAHQTTVIREMARANLDFQEYAVQVERRSMEEERKRITREIHDLMGFTLTSLRMLFEAGDILIEQDPRELRRLMLQGKVQLEDSQQEIRRALHQLRESQERSFPILRRIRNLTQNFSQATGIRVDLQTTNVRGDLPWEIEHLLYRGVQEGMTNAFLHGKARAIQIILHWTGQELRLTVMDDGVGSKQNGEGIGLGGMRERLQPLAGRLESHSLDPGFSLTIAIPWRGREVQRPVSGETGSPADGFREDGE